MPRRPLVETLAAACVGRPTFSLEPPPTSVTGVAVAVASASRRENSRSSTGRMLLSTWALSSRRVLRRLAALEREHLGRVEQPLGIEHRLDAHLHAQIGLVELHAHQVALLDAHAVLAGEAAAGRHAQLEDLVARLLGALRLRRI